MIGKYLEVKRNDQDKQTTIDSIKIVIIVRDNRIKSWITNVDQTKNKRRHYILRNVQ